MYYTNSLVERPVHLDAVNQSMDAILSRQWHLHGVPLVTVYPDVKHGGLLLSGLMAATTSILMELDPLFMLPDTHYSP